MDARWLKLDNAALLFPAKVSVDDTCVFRVYAILKEEVRPGALQQSVLDLKRRFPTLYVKLRDGFFWHYYEPNERDLIVRQESGEITRLLDGHKNNGYLFSVQYHERRISVEVFHALGDGGTAIEYLNALLLRYFTLLGYAIDPMGKVLTFDQEPCEAEIEDSYTKYYTGREKREKPAGFAYRIKGTLFPVPGNFGVLHGVMESDTLVKAAHVHRTTVTKYLVAQLIRSIWLAGEGDCDRLKLPVCVNVPVNMRKILPSRTLRNFTLYFTVRHEAMAALEPFADTLACVDREFAHSCRLPVLQRLLNANVSVQKSRMISLLPLPVKHIAIDVISRFLSKNHLTSSLSNLGQVDLPDGMATFVERYGVIPPLGDDMSICMSVISSCGTTEVTFMRSIQETNVEREFFGAMVRDGVPVMLTTNLAG